MSCMSKLSASASPCSLITVPRHVRGLVCKGQPLCASAAALCSCTTCVCKLGQGSAVGVRASLARISSGSLSQSPCVQRGEELQESGLQRPRAFPQRAAAVDGQGSDAARGDGGAAAAADAGFGTTAGQAASKPVSEAVLAMFGS